MATTVASASVPTAPLSSSPPPPPSSEQDLSSKFPCALTMHFPLPDHRLASIALRALQVDAELSPLVWRTFSLVASATSDPVARPTTTPKESEGSETPDEDSLNILCVEYRAATDRMLRVAVNGFMESFRVVLHVMQELDVDVLEAADHESTQPQTLSQ